MISKDVNEAKSDKPDGSFDPGGEEKHEMKENGGKNGGRSDSSENEASPLCVPYLDNYNDASVSQHVELEDTDDPPKPYAESVTPPRGPSGIAMSLAQLSPIKVLPRPVSRWPLLFERAAPSWWNPRFDSSILEEQYWKSTFPRTTRRFQFGLVYLLILTLCLCIYFPAMNTPSWPYYLGFGIGVIFLLVGVLWMTTTTMYQDHCYKISLTLSLTLCTLSLLATRSLKKDENGERDISPAGLYSIYLDLLLVLYTVVPLPFYGTLLIGFSYSFLFELLLVLAVPERIEKSSTTILNVLIHLCIHLLGVHILITTQVRMRDTFMKVGQSLMVKKQLVTEKGVKEKMIHSVMPPKVADWLMKEGHAGDDDDLGGGPLNAFGGHSKGHHRKQSFFGRDSFSSDEYNGSENSSMVRKVSSPRSSNQGDIRTTMFRPFNMNAMDDVSIVFADIVGFTKMSSNKTASQLVGLLNDLFGRFDNLCTKLGCEKISTLGDCYYCVSGCPEPIPNHAMNCVEMGLAMISAIREFDEDRHESVNMRVGIHTGTVLCGIVGKRRFKFDVWSNDVSFANIMESTGKPGMVHISENTYAFLKDQYFVLEGDPVKGKKTYFISGRAGTSATPPLKLSGEIDSPDSVDANSGAAEKSGGGDGESQQSKSAKSIKMGSAIKSKLKKNEKSEKSTKENLASADKSKSSFSLTTKSYAKIGNNSVSTNGKPNLVQSLGTMKGANSSGGGDGDCETLVASKVTLPDGSSNAILNRRCSHSLPSLQSSREFSAIIGMNGNNELRHELSRNSVKSPASRNLDLEGREMGDTVPSSPSQKSPSKLASIQSDQAMIKCVKDDDSHYTYFTKPPLKRGTLFFRNPQVEKQYRRTAWRPRNNNSTTTTMQRNIHSEGENLQKIWAPSIFNAYFDLLLSFLTFFIVCLATFLHYPFTWPWVFYFVMAAFYHISVILVFAAHASQQRKAFRRRSAISRLYSWARGWIPSHCFGLPLTSLPMLAIFANFKCSEVVHDLERDFFLQLVYVGLLHFCNLSALNYGVKSFVASLCACAVVILYSPLSCVSHCIRVTSAVDGGYDATTIINVTATDFIRDDNDLGFQNQTLHEMCFVDEAVAHRLFIEAAVCIAMLLALVWMLNREFEIAYRISFHCSLLSAQDRRKIQNLKNQADWLLHNIIPNHISDSLKKSSGYSENHREVGIIFASLVNFNELYDESYMGGKEYLRVLNELISDFDEILDRPEFKNVEKIKTIGSTFMAASGMNPFIRQENTHKFQHIHELMEFVFELQRSVSEFNKSLIEFDLVLRVGFNHGDVTAGVIGTTKLYYDIWGDAVNIASRMESTGVEGRVQVVEQCMHVLSEWYTFELRGSIVIKGKGNMTTYLLIGNKPDSCVSAVC